MGICMGGICMVMGIGMGMCMGNCMGGDPMGIVAAPALGGVLGPLVGSRFLRGVGVFISFPS